MIIRFTSDTRTQFILFSLFSKLKGIIAKQTPLNKLGLLVSKIMTVILLINVLNPVKAVAQNNTSISIWDSTTVPRIITDTDKRSVELGVKFRVTINGFITGIRFYKGPTNTGTHVGTLWSRTGTVLARATFTNETSSGWQQVLFSSPVAITAGTTYVASYHANVGRYSINENYFTTNIGVNPVLQALRNGLDGGNGVYRYGANSIFPNSSTKSSNYWVDVVFTNSIAPDTTPPTVTANNPASAASEVSTLSVLTATFSEAIDQGTLSNATFELRNSSNTLVPGTVSYNATTRVATLTPSTALSYSTVYTATLKGGTADPRIKDAAGNAMAADHSWSFTTGNPSPLTVNSTSPANLASGVLTNSVIRAFFNQALDPTTVSSNTIELRNSSGELVQATIAYNSSTLSATLTPAAPLEVSTAYTFTIRGGDTGIKGLAGNTLSSNVSSSFTTANMQTLSGPFSIWDPTTVPVPTPVTDPDTRAVELGVKFRASVDGMITGIRFYKSASNTGVHVATLWSRSGTNLARATFIAESASGWQQVVFATPVAITAGTTYVASYHTNTGRYSISENFFNGTSVTTPYLQALARGIDGPNGVYRYSANSIYPNQQNNSSNYWVDVLFVDNNPPRVTATTPLSGATEVNTTSAITAVFNEGIDPATLTNSSFELRSAANTLIPGAITYNSTTRTATLTPSAALANSTVYTATLRGGSVNPQIKDLAGNALSSNYTWSFTTVAAIAPKITATSPQNGSTGILTTANLTVTFDLEIDPATLTNTTFELRNASNVVIPGAITYNASTRTATLTPSTALANSTTYTATVKGGATDPRVKDLAGNPLAADYTWTFTTIAATPLSVTANSPQNGTTGVLTTADISATFNNVLDETTITSSTFELRNASNTLIPGTLSYASATGIATLKPSAPLANSTVYTATIKGGLTDPRIKDLAGNSLTANYSWSFTTAAAIAPEITATSPQNGSTGILTTANLTVTFDLEIDPETITNTTFELRNASNVIIPGAITYNASTRTATLTPSTALANSTTYTATVKGGATDPRVKDLAGNPLAADYTWTFTTIAATPLSVTANSPQNGATGVLTTADISATFNNVLDQTTITSSTFEVRNASNTLIPGTLTYAEATGTLTLTPSAPLANSTVYTATLKGGSSDPRIKDIAGNSLETNFTWSFTTAAAIVPVVISTTPDNGATGISPTVTVTAVFDLQINPTTITNNTFELRNSNNTLIPGTIEYNSTTRTATFTPSEALDNSMVYTATLKGGASDPRIEDTNGRSLAADHVWSFTVVAAPALVVIENSPQDGATGVLTTASINAIFNHDINSATLSSSTFTLRNSSNTAIPGTITYDPETRTATFMPSTALANSSVYTATLRGGSTDPRIKDVSGNAMATDYVWTFTTIGGGPQTGTFSIWPATTLPGTIAAADAEPVELGVKFQALSDGFITGIRFYKSSTNTGTHIGNLWSRNGANLARATFSTETSSGWQEVLFDTPVAITKETTYIASYFTPTGNYSFDGGYFTNPVSTDQLIALQEGTDGSNGVYSYSSVTTFPSASFNSGNYWVDVVFETTVGPDVKSPTVTSTSPANLATGINISSDIFATFSEAINEGTVSNSTFKLSDGSGQAVSAVISYSSTSRTATLTPSSPLEYFTDYIATLKGIRDLAGNVMADFEWTFKTSQIPPLPPEDGQGGPILIISAASNPFSRYAVEILRAEGLNEFKAMDISTVTSSVLNNYDIVILGEQPLTLSQVTMLTDWVNGGGTFISFKPDLKLASLLGITRTTGTAANEYLLVNTASGPGVGIVNETIQYHGTADLYTLNGATALATLYSTANTAMVNPAITSRNVGLNGGQAIAFTYDLARSIVYTRQGNPAWEKQDRDGLAPVRSNDLYYGNASFDRKPDWIDFKKVAIPQADEQQRLLANIIIQGNLDRKPLPRFWYLPKGLKAAVVMTGDDHANGGTIARFNHYKSISTSNTAEAVADWIAIRGSSYIYPNTPITRNQVNGFQADGFEIGLHLNTNCAGFTESSWLNSWTSQWAQISTAFPGLNVATTNRTHCIPWSDWTTQAKTSAAKGVRLDANYYYWPGSWVQSRAGMFTGSGIPMRFADLNGNIIDCYQVTTQVTDESDINNYSVFISSLLDKAIGSEGFYGAFCANMHTDDGTSSGSEAIINSAVSRGIPVISAKQLLTWLDGRNNSAFKNLTWNTNELNFDLIAAEGSRNLKGMLPFRTLTQELNMILMGTASVPFTRETIKGIEYAFFDGKDGNYTAIYGNATQPLSSISDISEMNLVNSNQKTLDQNIKLSVFPNPFAEYATAEFSTPKNEKKVYLDVYNVNGVKVRNLYEGPTVAHELNRFEINSLNLSPGVYFIHFITPQKTVTTKVITN